MNSAEVPEELRYKQRYGSTGSRPKNNLTMCMDLHQVP